jgi:fatty-acyl-CoA synthase
VHLSTLLDMSADCLGDRIAFADDERSLTHLELRDTAGRAAAWIRSKGVERAGLVDLNSVAVPVLLYGAALAGVPFVPVNYRLADDQLRAVLARTAPAVVVVADDVPGRVGSIDGVELVTRTTFFAEIAELEAVPSSPDADVEDIAVLLFTSGTTGEPKAAVLRHKHLGSYVIGTVEFMGSDEEDAAVVSVPPYHIAGISAVLSSAYSGRRVAYLSAFSPEDWVRVAREQQATHAMVVPTMLGRIMEVVDKDGLGLPNLRHVSYGGGRMPVPVIERALTLLPGVDFVNAYGLTETSSTIAVLLPDDHREAVASDDPAVRARLGSVGRPLPTVEVEIRDAMGDPVPAGESGELWVRGEQVAGEYLGRPDVMEAGWFPTKDAAHLDADGYLYLEGRMDDVIVRGAENLSPGEIEDALHAHPAVADAAVVGVPDREWGETVAAVVVLEEGATATPDELKEWVRSQLRGSRTPEHIEVRDVLPYTETGKLLRRIIKAELVAAYGTPG